MCNKKCRKETGIIMNDMIFVFLDYDVDNWQERLGIEKEIQYLDEVVEKLKSIPEIDFAYYKDSYSDDWLVEIYSHTASKANGAREVKEIVRADSITAFGDNLNDIIMLKGADTAVAVENAVPQVKEIADVIIGNNNDDSVVKFIIEKEK